jgi:hypothetical protein
LRIVDSLRLPARDAGNKRRLKVQRGDHTCLKQNDSHNKCTAFPRLGEDKLTATERRCELAVYLSTMEAAAEVASA